MAVRGGQNQPLCDVCSFLSAWPNSNTQKPSVLVYVQTQKVRGVTNMVCRRMEISINIICLPSASLLARTHRSQIFKNPEQHAMSFLDARITQNLHLKIKIQTKRADGPVRRSKYKKNCAMSSLFCFLCQLKSITKTTHAHLLLDFSKQHQSLRMSSLWPK